MKFLIINFSPRRKGNSEWVSNELYKNFKKFYETNLININDLNINKCGNCQNYCYVNGRCIIKDDMEILYNYFEQKNIFVFVTPVYFYHIPGYAKIMIDRCQPYWVKKYLFKKNIDEKKFGSLICIAATCGEKVFEGINLTMKYFFDILNFNFNKKNNLYINKVDERLSILKYKSLIKNYLYSLEQTLLGGVIYGEKSKQKNSR